MKTRPFDPAEYLTTAEEAALYLTEALETGDPAVISAALRDVARALTASDFAGESTKSQN